ncbi:MAG: hypothetical protein AAGI88_21345 [Pseudomonadota bacterium]
MNKILGLSIGLFLILGLSNSVIAGPFTASYDFGGPATGGDIFTFDFNGTINSVDSNLIEGVTALSNFRLGGVDVFSPGDPGIFGGPITTLLGLLSFDGTANNFIATNPGAADAVAFQTSFGALVQSNLAFGPSGFLISESFDPTRWSVRELSVTARVPAPSPLLLLFGAGLVFCHRQIQSKTYRSIAET